MATCLVREPTSWLLQHLVTEAHAARYLPNALFPCLQTHEDNPQAIGRLTAACMGQAAVTDGSDYMLHVARVHARRRGWDADAKQASPEEEGMPPTTAPAGPTGCADVTLVTQSCGGETSTGHPPSDCSSVACGRAFVSWFEACPAASSSPDLTTFHARCLETHSSGH